MYVSRVVTAGVKEAQEQQRLSDGAGGGGSGSRALDTGSSDAVTAGGVSASGSGGGGGGGVDKTSAGTPSMRESLHVLMRRLGDKRRDADRPEDLMVSDLTPTDRKCLRYYMSTAASQKCKM